MPRHLPVLDGLRGLAVLLVLWCHVPPSLAGYPEWLRFTYWFVEPGGLGVETFFVLSGFLITRILLAERELGAPVRWFLLRRLLRIAPIYLLLLAVMATRRPLPEIGWCAVYLFNIASITTPMPGPLEHTWSLCVEEHFYLVWPLVVAFLPRGWSLRVLAFGIVPLALLSMVVACTRFEAVTAQLVIERFTPCRCLGLAVGALFAFGERSLLATRARATCLAAALLLLAGLGHPHFWFLLGPYWTGSGEWVSLYWAPMWWRVQTVALCAGLLLWCLRPGPGVLAFVFSTAPLRAIGRISYGLYLYHLPLYYALAPTPNWPEIALAVGATFGVATLSFVLLERPLLRFGARFRGRAAAPA